MKLRVKLTLFFTTTSIIVLIIFGFTLNSYIAGTFIDGIDRGLYGFHKRISPIIESNPFKNLEELETINKAYRLFDEEDSDQLGNFFWFALYDSSNNIVKSTRLAKLFPIDLQSLTTEKGKFYHTVDIPEENNLFPGQNYDEIFLRGRVDHFQVEGESYSVLTAISITRELEHLRKLERVLFRAILILIVISFISGFFFVTFMLKPITNITKSLNRISKDDLSERLPVKRGKDELGQLTTSINHLFERLEHGFKLEKQFISDVSHEFKTPLAVMRLSVENVINSPNISDDEAERLGNVLESLYSLDFLVKKLLYLSQLEQDRCPFKPAPFNLSNTLERITNTLSLIAEEKGLNFKSFCREEELTLAGDEELLYIALFNIVENAIKYTDRGSVQVISERRDGEIVVSVEDSGCGIAKEQLEDIFEKFYRVDESRSGRQGYGIGLSITKRIIKLHEGRIEVESIPGMKTIFKVILPLNGSPAGG